MYPDDFLQKKLDERRENQSLRQLRLPNGKTDFSSNDYLGIVRNNILNQPPTSNNHQPSTLNDYQPSTLNDPKLQTINQPTTPNPKPLTPNPQPLTPNQPPTPNPQPLTPNQKPLTKKSSSTGSRLLSGNYQLIEEVEKQIAKFHEADAALIFNSGYDANLGLLAAVAQRGDTIIYDQLSHASIRDGIRLSFAQSFAFAHNDGADLEKKLALATGNIFIVTESVFSMDGDICPLADWVLLAKKYGAHLIIDEAHATGVIGQKGEGLVQQLGYADAIFARIHTFGKALGSHGAVVLGSEALRLYLINFARSLVYTTALPEQTIVDIQTSYQIFPFLVQEREHLQRLIQQFQNAVLAYDKLVSATPIQIVMIPGNEAAVKLADRLQLQGMDVRAILYPTVPKGGERLRIVLHAFNTQAELDNLIDLLN